MQRRLRRIRTAERFVRRMISAILILSAVYLADTALDMYRFTHRDQTGSEFTSFADLCDVNPDVAAWLRLDGTRIDYPVVRGRDNFEYLSKDMRGMDYAGGCLFIDAECSKDLSDEYIIIHGHNMAGGAMFGDLSRYRGSHFFSVNSTGVLLTPDSIYELTVAGVATADAYDSDVYYVSHDRSMPLDLLERCSLARDLKFVPGDKMIALSTCSGDMTNARTVVYVRARYKGENPE